MAKLDEVLKELSELLKIDSFSKNENGLYHLSIDDDIQLQFFESLQTNELIVLCDTVQTPDAENDGRFLRALLRANYRWHFSAGGSFGLNPNSNMVEFCLRESLNEMTAEKLNTIFESVMAAIMTIRNELRTLPDSRPDIPPEDLIERIMNAAEDSDQYIQA